MSNLIVEFPRNRNRRHSSVDVETEKAKEVRFHPKREVQLYHLHPEFDPNEMFWTRDDYREMKATRARDVRDLYLRYLSPGENGDREEFPDAEFTGLENVLSQDLVARLENRRKRLFRAVLTEQAKQDETGECNPYKIADASKQFSEQSLQRAAIIAEVLDC